MDQHFPAKAAVELRTRLEELISQNGSLAAAIEAKLLRSESENQYAQHLEQMTSDEAIEHLRSVDDSHVWAAYCILSERLNAASLSVVCREYLSRPEPNVRRVGVLGVGVNLKRTCDRDASRALAEIIRNDKELFVIRKEACTSLELIQWDKGIVLRESADDFIGLTSAVDWRFVDSFLS